MRQREGKRVSASVAAVLQSRSNSRGIAKAVRSPAKAGYLITEAQTAAAKAARNGEQAKAC